MAWRWGVLVVALTASFSCDARANSAPILLFGERHGPLVPQRSSSVRIEHEDLVFDIDADSRRAVVTVTYRMTADAAERLEVAFVYVRGSADYSYLMKTDVAVEIDAEPVDYQLKTDGEILEPRLHAWLEERPEAATQLARALESTLDDDVDEDEIARGADERCRSTGCPSLVHWLANQRSNVVFRRVWALHAAREVIPDAVEELQHGWSTLAEQRDLAFVLFPVAWSAGQSRSVVVRYLHEPTLDRREHVKGIDIFDYLLRPASQWAAFGTLDVTVRLPPEADFESELPFARDGAVHRAHFGSLPHGELTFTVTRRRGLFLGLVRYRDYWTLLAAATLGAGALLGAVAGLWLRMTKTRLIVAGLVAGSAGLGVCLRLDAQLPRNARGFDYDLEPPAKPHLLAVPAAAVGFGVAIALATRRKRLSRP